MGADHISKLRVSAELGYNIVYRQNVEVFVKDPWYGDLTPRFLKLQTEPDNEGIIEGDVPEYGYVFVDHSLV